MITNTIKCHQRRIELASVSFLHSGYADLRIENCTNASRITATKHTLRSSRAISDLRLDLVLTLSVTTWKTTKGKKQHQARGGGTHHHTTWEEGEHLTKKKREERETPPPTRRRKGSTTTQKEEGRKKPHPSGHGERGSTNHEEKAAPPTRRRESSTTQEGKAASSTGSKRRRGESSTTEKEERHRVLVPKRREESSTLSFGWCCCFFLRFGWRCRLPLLGSRLLLGDTDFYPSCFDVMLFFYILLFGVTLHICSSCIRTSIFLRVMETIMIFVSETLLLSSPSSLKEHNQHCHVGNTAPGCRLGLFQ